MVNNIRKVSDRDKKLWDSKLRFRLTIILISAFFILGGSMMIFAYAYLFMDYMMLYRRNMLLLFGAVIVLAIIFAVIISQIVIRRFVVDQMKESTLQEEYKNTNELNNTLVKITQSQAFSFGTLEEAAQVVAQEAQRTLGVQRVGVWRITEDKKVLMSVVSYDTDVGGFYLEDDCSLGNNAEYFELLLSERLVVLNTPRELSIFLENFDPKVCAWLDAPIRLDGQLVGAVCIEQKYCDDYPNGREWTIDEQNFASSLADLMAIAIANDQRRLFINRTDALVRNLPGMIYQSVNNPPDYTAVFVSEGSVVLTGYTPEEFVGDNAVTILDIVHPDDIENYLSLTESLRSQSMFFEAEFRIIAKDGTIKWVWERSQVIEFKLDGTPNIIEGFYIDITELKRLKSVELESDMLITVNSVSAILLEPDMDKFEDNLYISMGLLGHAVNVDRVYIWQNHKIDGKLYCTQLYEWSEGAEPQQGNEYSVNISYDDIVPGLEERLKRGECLNGVVREMPIEYQRQLVPQSVLSIIIVPVFLHEELWGFVGFDDCKNERVFSINEEIILRSASRMIANALLRQTMSQEIQVALEQAKAGSKAKGDFLSIMSHEMRTPMNAIIGMTAIAERTNNIYEKNHALSKIGDASNYLLGVINDILDMAKIEANKLELAPIEFNFEEMLRKAITIINFRIEEKAQQLTLQVDDNIPLSLVGDDQRLSQVITNILSNAVKFTPEHGEIHLEASLVDETDGVCELRFVVVDSGIGISIEQQERLFQAFEQAEGGISREYGGTGLGLVISKSIVESMDGSISVESELGKGAKFIFTVKMKRCEKDLRSVGAFELSDKDLTTPDEATHDGKAFNFSSKKMLLVEDIDINREILIALLEDTGLEIDCAQNGKRALEMVQAAPEKYDIVFMDIQMPEMDGYEATRCIRALPEMNCADMPILPIVAMTANVFKDDIEACLAAGMNDHLGKPFDIENIMQVLRKYLT